MSALKKRNKEYNETRKRLSDLKKKDINHDKALEKIHGNSASRIQSQIDNFYLKYATSDGLSIGEARKRASNFDVTQYFDKAKKAVADKDFSAETNAWLKDYNRKMRISRLEVLQGEIQLELLNMTEHKIEYVYGALDDSLKAEYEAQRKKIKEQLNKNRDQAGILNMSTRSPMDKYKGIINADFYGNHFSDKLWGYARDMDRDISNSLSRIFTDMMGYQEERTRLKRKFDVSDYEAQRLLRTEMRRVNSQLQEEMLKDNGFTHMIYVTEPGACEICAPLENKAIPIEDIVIGINQPPMHPNCYCSMYGHIEMEDIYGKSTLDEFEKYDESDIPDPEQELPTDPYELLRMNSRYIPNEKLTYNLSKEEVSQRLMDEFGMNLRETSRTKLSEEALNQTYSTLKTWENLYNELEYKIPAIEAVPPSKAGRSVAYYSHFSDGEPDSFGLHSKIFKDHDTLQDYINSKVDSGWLSNNRSADRLIEHEFAHHIDVQMTIGKRKKFNRRVFDKLIEESDGKYTDYSIAEQTSGYAKTYFLQTRGDHTETFAELFSEAYGETPSELANDFKRVFETMIAEEME